MTPASFPLHEFQDAFSRALMGRHTADGMLAAVCAQPGFAVYRNTVLKACVDALEANFPSVQRLVGEEWFRAAAAIYAGNHLPSTPALLDYGAAFPEFLAAFEPAAELPYLADVATLDRYWTEAHVAPDEASLDAACIACLDSEQLAQVHLRPHSSARWAFFPRAPIATLWRRNREESAASLHDIGWQGEGVLILRPRWTVEALDLDAAGCAFLDACNEGQTLDAAAARTLAIEPKADLASLMSQLLTAGAFARLRHADDCLKEDRQ